MIDGRGRGTSVEMPAPVSNGGCPSAPRNPAFRTASCVAADRSQAANSREAAARPGSAAVTTYG